MIRAVAALYSRGALNNSPAPPCLWPDPNVCAYMRDGDNNNNNATIIIIIIIIGRIKRTDKKINDRPN